MKALVLNDICVQLEEDEDVFEVAPTLTWMDAPDGCRYGWVLKDGSLVEQTFTPAMEQLRSKRDNRLIETDWWGVSDLSMSDAQKAYRQALRDFPSTSATPKLNVEGVLTGVTWPTEPEGWETPGRAEGE